MSSIENKATIENEILRYLIENFETGLYPEEQKPKAPVRLTQGIHLSRDNDRVNGYIGAHYQTPKINTNVRLKVDLHPFSKYIAGQWDEITQTNDCGQYDSHPLDYCLTGIRLMVQETPNRLQMQLQDGGFKITADNGAEIKVPFLVIPCCYFEVSPSMPKVAYENKGVMRVNGRTIPLQTAQTTQEAGMELKLWHLGISNAVAGDPPAFVVRVSKQGPIYPNGLKGEPVKDITGLYSKMLESPRALQNYGIPRSIFEQRAKQAIPSMVELANYRDTDLSEDWFEALLEEYLHTHPDPRLLRETTKPSFQPQFDDGIE